MPRRNHHARPRPEPEPLDALYLAGNDLAVILMQLREHRGTPSSPDARR